MKKILSVILVLAMLLCTASCAISDDSGKVSSENEESSELVPVSEDESLPAYEPSLNSMGFDEGAYISPTVLYDSEIATVTATGITYSEGAAALNIEIVNHSDTQIQFSAEYISVNGLMEGDYGFAFIDPGQTSEGESIGFFYEDLIPCGVNVLSEIIIGEINITVFNDDWTEISAGPVCLRTNAYGIAEISESCYDSMISDQNQSDYSYTVLGSSAERIDIDSGIYATAAVLTVDEYDSFELCVELHNDTSEKVKLSLRDPVINGIHLTTNGYSITEMLPNSYEMFKIQIRDYGVPEYCFESFGIEHVNTITYTLAIEPDGMDASVFVQSELVISEPDDTAEEKGETVYDKDGLTIKSMGIVPEFAEEDSVGSAAVMMLIENNTGKNLDLQDNGFGDLVINGVEVEFYSLYCTIKDGTLCAVCYTTSGFLTDDCGITSIDEITDAEMTLHFYDSNNYSEEAEVVVPIIGG